MQPALTGITVLELACLMPIGLAAAEGRRLPARVALYRAALRVPQLLALAAHMVVRVALGHRIIKPMSPDDVTSAI